LHHIIPQGKEILASSLLSEYIAYSSLKSEKAINKLLNSMHEVLNSNVASTHFIRRLHTRSAGFTRAQVHIRVKRLHNWRQIFHNIRNMHMRLVQH
jgi:hypothetical protein